LHGKNNKKRSNSKQPVIIFAGLVILMVLTFTSCLEGIIYEKDFAIEDSGWSENDTLHYSFEVNDTTKYTDIYLHLRIDNDYPFNNCYTHVELLGPNGQKIQEVRSFDLADKSGKWKGKGYGALISFEFPFFKHLELTDVGEYSINIRQYMRVNTLPGVHDVGIRVLQEDPRL
jgi:gliding motility-associated lipoprotein GldH